MFGIATCVLAIIYFTGNHEVGTWLAICGIGTFVFDNLSAIIANIAKKQKMKTENILQKSLDKSTEICYNTIEDKKRRK